jgi:hypothetical protein
MRRSFGETQAKSLLDERTNSVGERWLAVSGSRPSSGLENGRKIRSS